MIYFSGAPTLWMTSAQLSLKTPLSPAPQLCPGPSVLPPQGLPGCCRYPHPQPIQPELYLAEAKRSHPHTPTAPSQAGPGQELTGGSAQGRPCPSEKGARPSRSPGWESGSSHQLCPFLLRGPRKPLCLPGLLIWEVEGGAPSWCDKGLSWNSLIF